MNTEDYRLMPESFNNPERDIIALRTALMTRTLELTGYEDVLTFNTDEDWVMIAQMIVDPAAETFLHNDFQITNDQSDRSNGPPFNYEYDYIRACELMGIETTMEMDNDWYEVYKRIQNIRELIARGMMREYNDPKMNEQVIELRKMMGQHMGLYYSLLYKETGEVLPFQRPFSFKTVEKPLIETKNQTQSFEKKRKKRKPETESTLVLDYTEADKRGWLRRKLTPQQPRHLEIGPTKDSIVTVIGSGLMQMASEFAGSETSFIFMETNPVGSYAIQEFVRQLGKKGERMYVATDNIDIDAALKESDALLLHNVFEADPFRYTSPNQYSCDPYIVDIDCLLENARNIMQPGKLIVIQHTTPAFERGVDNPLDVVQPYDDLFNSLLKSVGAEPVITPASVELLPPIVDGRNHIDGLFTRNQIPTMADYCEINQDGSFRIVGRIFNQPVPLSLRESPYVNYPAMFEPEPKAIPLRHIETQHIPIEVVCDEVPVPLMPLPEHNVEVTAGNDGSKNGIEPPTKRRKGKRGRAAAK